MDARHRPQPGDRLAAALLGLGARSSTSTTTRCSSRSPPAELTDSEAIRRETSRKVRGALRELPEEQGEVIGLAYFGGFTHAEIA